MVAMVGVTVIEEMVGPVGAVTVEALPLPPQAVSARLSPLARKIAATQWVFLMLALQNPLGSVAALYLGCGENPNAKSI
jgi:hypothetical protein